MPVSLAIKLNSVLVQAMQVFAQTVTYMISRLTYISLLLNIMSQLLRVTIYTYIVQLGHLMLSIISQPMDA